MDSHKAMQLVTFTHRPNLSTFTPANDHENIFRYPFDDGTAYPTPRPSFTPAGTPNIVHPPKDNPTLSDMQRMHVALASSAPPARSTDVTTSTDRSRSNIREHLGAIKAEIELVEKGLKYAPPGTDEHKALHEYIAQLKFEVKALKHELAVLWKVDRDAQKALWHAFGQRS